MGAGIALAIKTKYPDAYAADCETVKSDRNKLGSFSYADVMGSSGPFTIVNAYTQFHWRGKGVKVDYHAVRKVMSGVKMRYSGKRIGYPLIGAGLAGGDWGVISAIIDEELFGEDLQ